MRCVVNQTTRIDFLIWEVNSIIYLISIYMKINYDKILWILFN